MSNRYYGEYVQAQMGKDKGMIYVAMPPRLASLFRLLADARLRSLPRLPKDMEEPAEEFVRAMDAVIVGMPGSYPRTSDDAQIEFIEHFSRLMDEEENA